MSRAVWSAMWRRTSCFPAVFPPVNPAAFGKTIGDSVAPLLERCFRAYTLSGADPNETYFIDGGVLDNKPFGWAIDAQNGTSATKSDKYSDAFLRRFKLPP